MKGRILEKRKCRCGEEGRRRCCMRGDARHVMHPQSCDGRDGACHEQQQDSGLCVYLTTSHAWTRGSCIPVMLPFFGFRHPHAFFLETLFPVSPFPSSSFLISSLFDLMMMRSLISRPPFRDDLSPDPLVRLLIFAAASSRCCWCNRDRIFLSLFLLFVALSSFFPGAFPCLSAEIVLLLQQPSPGIECSIRNSSREHPLSFLTLCLCLTVLPVVWILKTGDQSWQPEFSSDGRFSCSISCDPITSKNSSHIIRSTTWKAVSGSRRYMVISFVLFPHPMSLACVSLSWCCWCICWCVAVFDDSGYGLSSFLSWRKKKGWFLQFKYALPLISMDYYPTRDQSSYFLILVSWSISDVREMIVMDEVLFSRRYQAFSYGTRADDVSPLSNYDTASVTANDTQTARISIPDQSIPFCLIGSGDGKRWKEGRKWNKTTVPKKLMHLKFFHPPFFRLPLFISSFHPHASEPALFSLNWFPSVWKNRERFSEYKVVGTFCIHHHAPQWKCTLPPASCLWTPESGGNRWISFNGSSASFLCNKRRVHRLSGWWLPCKEVLMLGISSNVLPPFLWSQEERPLYSCSTPCQTCLLSCMCISNDGRWYKSSGSRHFHTRTRGLQPVFASASRCIRQPATRRWI